MAIQDDFSVAANGDIRYIGSTNNYTVIALHRWLGDLMDDAIASGNDILDITDATASARSTDNIITLNSPYNIDDTAAQHLYDGSVIQANGDTIYDGILVFANAGMYLDIVQNGTLASPNFWTTGLNADATAGISHRFMLKVRTGGADIDGRKLIGQTREFGYTYSEFKIGSTSRGNNVMALTYATDLNNQTASSTVAGWTTITNTEGYRALDIDANTVNEYYYSEWNKDTYSINQFYERMKWLTRRGTSSAIYDLNGALFRGITHEAGVATPTGTFTQTGSASWVSGTGELVAINHTTSATKMWIQVIKGLVPGSNQTVTVGPATIIVSSTTERTLSYPFCGVSTGAAIIGAYGFGIEPSDLTANDKLFDLTNTQITPPNNVTFTVGGLVANEDRVLVAPASGGLFYSNQFLLAVPLSGVETQVVINSVVPTDTPAQGSIRIELGTGIYKRVVYNSYVSQSSLFYISSTSFASDNAVSGNDVYISYIDQTASAATASFTSVYSAERPLFIRVRDGGATPIKTFETTGTLGPAGGQSTAIRTPDV